MTLIQEELTPNTFTTGTRSILIKDFKSGLEGKAFPDDDSMGLLPKPLVGVPLNFDAGELALWFPPMLL